MRNLQTRNRLTTLKSSHCVPGQSGEHGSCTADVARESLVDTMVIKARGGRVIGGALRH